VAVRLHVAAVIKTVKEKRPERIKDAYERAVRESDGYRTV
jgi:hypothetical protein